MRWARVVETRSLWVQVEEAEVEDSESCQHTYEVAVANEEPEVESAAVEVYEPHRLTNPGPPDAMLGEACEPLDFDYVVEVSP